MARHRRFRVPASYGWDFDGLPVRGWLTLAAAVLISAAMVWTLV
jgi:hypothetical protein